MNKKNAWLLPAPAKINMHLWVTGVLDDGRHTLDTSFAYVDVYDTVHVLPCHALRVHCSNTALNGEYNIVYRVLQALRQHCGIATGLDVYIDKKIPEQAGLGGGSSDAATALLAACKIWNLSISLGDLIAFATPWGADIPCFLFGKSSYASGVGEQLQMNPNPLPDKALCLVRPSMGLSTKIVFEYFDRHDGLTAQTMLASLRAASLQGAFFGTNMLESSACSLLPEVGQLLRHLRRVSDTVWMSGSGSCCIALCNHKNEAKRLANQMKTLDNPCWTHVGRLLDEHPLHYLITKHEHLDHI
ncbi:MAG: 4-(cytidine 5'-diphospho)-2-C-methyl-D-erythritol kinase [Mariprofundaceae bacterium]|nr:4-(cytidine 5'-diphospho)-2-C-methyl-D-erythritol kinase [Mariprofundaceae bacterium]